MKTILVTGGYGFIGSCFVLQAIMRGDRVVNVDKLTYAADLSNLSEVADNANYQFVKGDICDEELIADIFAKNKIDWVVNFAAESHVDNSIKDPASFIKTNVFGVFNLLQNSLKYWQKSGYDDFRFLQVSTDEVYGSLGDVGKFDENSNYDPSSPYSASKAGADHLANAWYKTHGLPVIITNCTNNYGPRQHAEKLIPKIIGNALHGLTIPIYGDGSNVRDWIFVEDHCLGIFAALERGRIGESYGFSGNAEKSNNELAYIICQKLNELRPQRNGYEDLIEYITDRLGHDKRYAIDDKKAQNELGYKPQKSFDERISETIEYYLGLG